MKTNKTNTQREESTYALIVRSQEKKRIVAEAVVYGLIVLSALAAIWEFGEELFYFQS
jgi:ribosomal protein L23